MGKLGFKFKTMTLSVAKPAAFIVATLVATTGFSQTSSPTPTATPLAQKTSSLPSSSNPQDIQPSVANRRLIITKLKAVQEKQLQTIISIDDKVKGKLKETQGMKVTDDAVNSELRMNRLQETMENLDRQRKEAIERSQFIDRLVFAVDTKWTKDSIKTFLEQTLLDIASAEMNQTDSKTPSNVWKFATYLSVAIRELPEPREDMIAFIDNYMDFSSVTSPKSPAAFSQARSYTNGVKSEAAKVTNSEDLGDGIEKRIRRAEKEEPAVIQGTTSAPLDQMKPASELKINSPLEPGQPKTLPPSAPNPQPTASQNSN